MKLLSIGDKGPYVDAVQLALIRSGYLSGVPDGDFGQKTLDAVTLFQKSMGLTQDGVVGAKTWERLIPYIKGYFVYTIKKGDTFYTLSKKYYTTLSAIIWANPDLNPSRLPIGQQIVIPFGFSVVPSNANYSSFLVSLIIDGLCARYPFIGRQRIGKSVMGRDITNLTLGIGTKQAFYNAAHHANEWITVPLLLTFIEKYAFAIASGGKIYGRTASDLAAETTLYAVPLVNPDGMDLVTGAVDDGVYYDFAKSISENYPEIPFPSGWKANISGIDTNLSYPAGWEEAREIKFAAGYVSPAPRDFVGESVLSAVESRALYDFTLKNKFDITLSYHTQGRVIYWKYLDYLPPRSQNIAEYFGNTSGYSVENTPFASGFAGYKDFFILKYNKPGYTIEVGEGENPLPLSQFQQIYNDNLGILVGGLYLA